QLAGVKAVSEGYPLRGRLRTASAPGAADAPAAGVPQPGTVWLEERLVSALNAPVGSTVRLGKSQLRVAAVLTLEPERSTNFFNLAPRLMMNIADVPATGLVQPGSRISYYLYAAGDRAAMAALEQTLRGALGAAIGYVAQLGIGAALAGLIRAELPPATPWPALQGFLVGLVLLLGFALPPLLQLKDVPAVRVIRREAGAPRQGALGAYAV